MANQRIKTSTLLVWLLYAVLAFGIVYVSSVFQRNYKGYCVAERRYLSETEKISIAVNFLLAANFPRSAWVAGDDGVTREIMLTHDSPERPIPYLNMKEFLEENPGCCSFEGSVK